MMSCDHNTYALVQSSNKKQKRTDLREDQCRLKRRRQVYETVTQLKKDGKVNGLYAEAARLLSPTILGITPDIVRNDYRAEEKLLNTSPMNSAIARLELCNGAPKSKICSKYRPAYYDLVDEKVVEWIYKQNLKGVTVSGAMIGERARYLVNLYIDVLGMPAPPKPFQGSSGYVSKLKERHNLEFCKVSGQKVSEDVDAVYRFIDKLRKIIEDGGYSLDQVYNVDETGLVWKQSAIHTHAPKARAKSKQLSSVKGSKTHVTLLLGGNATGTHKLKPLLIHKYQNPRGLEGQKAKDELPFYYERHPNAWMNSDIFKRWCVECFLPEICQFQREQNPTAEPKALLLIDNATVQLDAMADMSSDSLKIIFLPKYTTSLIQPMNQAAIKTFKFNYTKLLMAKVAPEENVHTFLNNLSLQQAIPMMSQAWDLVQHSTMKKSWNKLLTWIDGYESESVMASEVLQDELKQLSTSLNLRSVPWTDFLLEPDGDTRDMVLPTRREIEKYFSVYSQLILEKVAMIKDLALTTVSGEAFSDDSESDESISSLDTSSPEY